MATPLFLLPFLLLFTPVAQSKVQTFTYINQGELGPYVTEYDASYRTLPAFASPFQLCFYNTTPNAYSLAIRMATLRSTSLFRWIWEANRGIPVRENATFSLLPDGDLVLADADGRLVWSTGTANKGVVGLKLLPNGNMVLYNARGRFLWQSFEHPTDTLLVGQSITRAGTDKLISRAPDGSLGIYSLVLEPNRLSLFMNTLPYVNLMTIEGGDEGGSMTMESAKFSYEPNGAYDYVQLDVATLQGNTSSSSSALVSRTKYNATLSILRLEADGNLVVYTYYDPVDYEAWEKTYAFFSGVNGCQLPSKCGALGVCEDEMCVACPSVKGLVGWSKGCGAPKVGGCVGKFYKVVGVENFLTGYVAGEAGVKVEECKRRCNGDCGCKGFMYWEETSTCWLAPVLGTLAKVSNSAHVAYIKYTK